MCLFKSLLRLINSPPFCRYYSKNCDYEGSRYVDYWMTLFCYKLCRFYHFHKWLKNKQIERTRDCLPITFYQIFKVIAILKTSRLSHLRNCQSVAWGTSNLIRNFLNCLMSRNGKSCSLRKRHWNLLVF